jgi:hypothetical protein
MQVTEILKYVDDRDEIDLDGESYRVKPENIETLDDGQRVTKVNVVFGYPGLREYIEVVAMTQGGRGQAV